MTRFLMLPTVTTRINPKKRDPIVNFAKSVILTSDQYVEAAHQMKIRREEAAMVKECNREERVESHKRRAVKREEPMAQRALDHEESWRLKQQKATKQAETWACKAAEKEEGLCLRAARAAELAATRVAKAAGAAQKHWLTKSCNTRSMESP
jgi:hypothetical protein